MYDAILLPVDGSDPSDEAVAHAGALGAQFDATVHVLNVVELPTEAVNAGAGGATSNVIEALHDEAEELVTDAVDDLPEGVDVTDVVLEGYPAAAIREYAADNDVDLIVMGTHGRTGLERYLLGSTTERVVRSAERPVLTVGGAED
ncbi:MAG: universal stress protein [Halobacteriaceae archaeon]